MDITTVADGAAIKYVVPTLVTVVIFLLKDMWSEQKKDKLRAQTDLKELRDSELKTLKALVQELTIQYAVMKKDIDGLHRLRDDFNALFNKVRQMPAGVRGSGGDS